MRKNGWLANLMALMLISGSTGAARAEIIPPHGEGQIGLQAVVLCEELTVHQEPDASAGIVETLHEGDLLIIVRQEEDGWAYCCLGDEEDAPAGWVDPACLAVDPAWYRTEEKTAVYARNDPAAPEIALLDENTLLPILKAEGGWLLVGLGGTAGWIAAPADGRQDGERFEDAMMLEGMEETVRYEHAVNSEMGFELDFDCESFRRTSEPDRECFISLYDDPADPWNYLEIKHSEENADAVSAAIRQTMAGSAAVAEQDTLACVGSCIRIDASSGEDGTGAPFFLQTVYIVPVADGCLVATVHCTVESAEGFGARMRSMMNTLVVTAGQKE